MQYFYMHQIDIDANVVGSCFSIMNDIVGAVTFLIWSYVNGELIMFVHTQATGASFLPLAQIRVQ